MSLVKKALHRDPRRQWLCQVPGGDRAAGSALSWQPLSQARGNLPGAWTRPRWVRGGSPDCDSPSRTVSTASNLNTQRPQVLSAARRRGHRERPRLPVNKPLSPLPLRPQVRQWATFSCLRVPPPSPLPLKFHWSPSQRGQWSRE